MIRFSHLSDIHLGFYKGKEENGINGRFLDFVKTYNEAINFTIQKECDFCLVAGDMFKTKDPQPIELDYFTQGIKKLLDKNIQVVIVLGNHDLFSSTKLKNSISVLNTLGLKNLIISETSEIITLNLKNNGLVSIQTMPYPIRSNLNFKTNEETSKYVEEKIEEIYNLAEKNIPLIFLGHFSIKDSVVGSEQQYVNKFTEPMISLDVFKNKRYIYGAMGHLHKHQIILKEPLMVYGGSLNRCDFNEWREDKGFMFCEYDEILKYEFIKVNARRFVDLNYDMTKEESPQELILEDLKNRTEELKDSIVRLNVDLSEKNRYNYSIKDISDFLSAHCYDIHGTIFPHIQKSDSKKIETFNEYMSPTEALKEYCSINKKIENKDLFLKLGEEIIKESKKQLIK